MKFIEDAHKEIKNNIHFKFVLQVILAIGNYMNGGSSKGCAYGFDMEMLSSLDGAKSTEGTTFVMYLVETVNKLR